MCVSAAQVVTKMRLTVHGKMPFGRDIISYFWSLIWDPYMWLVGFLTVVGGVAWYFALSRLPVSLAVVFAAFVYPIVTFCGYFFFNETISPWALLGVTLITVGIILVGYSGFVGSSANVSIR